MYGDEAFDDIVGKQWYIRDPKIEPLLEGFRIERAITGDTISLCVPSVYVYMSVMQMPANCGAIIAYGIEDGRPDVIDFLARNVASIFGDKVIFMSATADRAEAFIKLGWSVGQEAYSARNYYGKMKYLFRTLSEDERAIRPWAGDDEHGDDCNCDECYDDRHYDCNFDECRDDSMPEADDPYQENEAGDTGL